MSGLGWFRAGGIGMLAVGLMHLSGELAPVPTDPEFVAMQEAMRAWKPTIAGVQTDGHAIQRDLNLSYSLFSLAVGAIALAGGSALAASPRALRRVALVHSVALAALVAASAAFRVIPPVIFYALVAALFAGAALRARA